MKLTTCSTLPFLVLLACGGETKPRPEAPRPTPTPAVKPVATAVRKPKPPPPPPPPPPMEWQASAQLVPLRGVKMTPLTIVFNQTEGESTRARSDGSFAKLKAGTYHLVVHSDDSCGARGGKFGPAMTEEDAFTPIVVPKRGAAPGVQADTLPIALDGDASAAGHTLVLHADKRGAPGKAVACGVILRDGE